MGIRIVMLILASIASAAALAGDGGGAAHAGAPTGTALKQAGSSAATPPGLAVMRSQLSGLQTAQSDGNLIITLEDPLFEANRAAVRPEATGALDRLARALAEMRHARITLDGHPDNSARRDRSMDLSLRRTDIVRAYLVTHGVDPARISAPELERNGLASGDAGRVDGEHGVRVDVIVDAGGAGPRRPR